jgi:hypothetical protein
MHLRYRFSAAFVPIRSGLGVQISQQCYSDGTIINLRFVSSYSAAKERNLLS